MSADSYGAKGQPEFDDGGAPDTAVDPTLVGQYAGIVGNRVVGTAAQRAAFGSIWAGFGTPWEGLSFYETDTGDTYIYNGSDWVITGANTTVWQRTAANLASNTSFSALSFDATSVLGNLFTHSAGVFTCVRAGLYRVDLSITYAGSATGTRGWRFLGVTERTKVTTSVSAGTVLSDEVWGVAQFDVGDTITAQGLQSSGGSLSTSAEIVFTRLGD